MLQGLHTSIVVKENVIDMGIDIKLHPAVLPLLSLLGRSLRLQVQQLGTIEVLIEISMTRWWFGN